MTSYCTIPISPDPYSSLILGFDSSCLASSDSQISRIDSEDDAVELHRFDQTRYQRSRFGSFSAAGQRMYGFVSRIGWTCEYGSAYGKCSEKHCRYQHYFN